MISPPPSYSMIYTHYINYYYFSLPAICHVFSFIPAIVTTSSTSRIFLLEVLTVPFNFLVQTFSCLGPSVATGWPNCKRSLSNMFLILILNEVIGIAVYLCNSQLAIRNIYSISPILTIIGSLSSFLTYKLTPFSYSI